MTEGAGSANHGSARITEGQALVQAARRLAAARDNPEELEEALRLNGVLWIIFATEVAKPENPLPTELKRNILSLTRFVEKTSREILASEDLKRLDTLVNINRNLAAGLLAQPGAKDGVVESRQLEAPKPQGASAGLDLDA